MAKYYKKVKNDTKIIFICTAVLFLASIIPFFMTANFTFPFYDDYHYGYLTHQAWLKDGSFISVLEAAAKQAELSYDGWQGTFTGIFFMALSPGIYDEHLYPVGIYLLIIMYILSIVIFFTTSLYGYFRMDGYAVGSVALIFAFLTMQFVPEPSTAFFWYNGGFYYMGFTAFALLMFSALLSSCRARSLQKQIIMGVLSLILAFIVGGGNFITGLVSCLALAIFLLYRAVVKRRRFIFPILVFALNLYTFYKNISAPGNELRQDYFIPMEPMEAIGTSIVYGLQFINDNLNLPILFGFALITPLIYSGAAKSKFKFKYPWLITLVSYLVYASSFTPSFYAMAISGADRSLNVSFVLLLLAIFLCLLYWCGWFSKQSAFKISTDEIKGMASPLKMFAMVIAVFLTVSMVGVSVMDINSSTTVSAVASLQNGEAEKFYGERSYQIDLLNDERKKDVYFPVHTVRPYLLYHSNLSRSPDNSINQVTAKYYGKNKIIRVP